MEIFASAGQKCCFRYIMVLDAYTAYYFSLLWSKCASYHKVSWMLHDVHWWSYSYKRFPDIVQFVYCIILTWYCLVSYWWKNMTPCCWQLALSPINAGLMIYSLCDTQHLQVLELTINTSSGQYYRNVMIIIYYCNDDKTYNSSQ